MKTARHRLAATLLAILPAALFAGGSAHAQAGSVNPAPDPKAASSAAAPASSAPVGPRLRSREETGNRAASPGDLAPERAVTPQITIPFGKKESPAAPLSKREERAARRPDAPVTGGIDDSVARCESQSDDGMRADCRAKLARESKPRAPN